MDLHPAGVEVSVDELELLPSASYMKPLTMRGPGGLWVQRHTIRDNPHSGDFARRVANANSFGSAAIASLRFR